MKKILIALVTLISAVSSFAQGDNVAEHDMREKI